MNRPPALLLPAACAAFALLFAAVVSPPCKAASLPAPSTRLSLSMGQGSAAEELTFEGMLAAYTAVRERFGADASVADLTVVDYSTYGSAEEKGLEGRHAFYLVNPGSVRGSQDPLNIVAFATRRAAVKHQLKVGGTVQTFEDMWNTAGQYYAEQHPAEEPTAPAPAKQRTRRSEYHASEDCNT